MALQIIADVSGTNSNSYVTLQEADAYVSGEFYSDEWFALSEEARKKALISATHMINQAYAYLGDKYRIKEDSTYNYTEQSLQFPRNYCYHYTPTLEVFIPEEVKQAVYILAHLLTKTDDAYETLKAQGITSLGLGNESFTLRDKPVFEKVEKLLNKHILRGGWLRRL